MVDFKNLKPFANKITQGITTKTMGSFNDQEKDFPNQLKTLETLTKNKPIFIRQVHGTEILKIDNPPKIQLEGDALITNQKGITLAIKVADCQGIVLYDPLHNALAAIHSGWRGATLWILKKTIDRMNKEYGTKTSDLIAGISPSIGPCCLEFSDPKKELPNHMHPFVHNRHLDLWSFSINELNQAGVKNIELKRECTKDNPNLYFSHRNGDTGRMAVFIGLTTTQ